MLRIRRPRNPRWHRVERRGQSHQLASAQRLGSGHQRRLRLTQARRLSITSKSSTCRICTPRCLRTCSVRAPTARTAPDAGLELHRPQRSHARRCGQRARYNLFNLGARYTPGGEQGRVTLRIYADNIADKRYWNDTGANSATHLSGWARPRRCGSRRITLSRISSQARRHAMSATVKSARNGWHAGRTRLAAVDARRSCARCLRQFPGLGEPIEILSVSPRPLSAAGVVRTQAARVFVKRHHRTVRDAKACSRSIASLPSASSGRSGPARPRVRHPARLQSKSASGLTKCTRRPTGIDLYDDAISWTPFRTAAHAHSAGQALARLHLASRRISRAAPQAAAARRKLHHLCRARSAAQN